MKKVLKATFVIIGTVIGAGFATGQEIHLFFGKVGKTGIFTLLFSSILSGLIIFKAMTFIQKHEIKSYYEFLEKLLNRNNRILINSIQMIVNIFLAVTFIVMCSGAGAFFHQEMGMPKIIGPIIMCAIFLLIYAKKTNGIVKLNEFAMPILIFLIASVYVCSGKNELQFNIETNSTIAFINPIIYASYNSIVLIPILIDLSDFIKTRKNAIKLSLICSTILAVLGEMILFIVLEEKEACYTEIPILFVAGKTSKTLSYMYGVAIILAMLTSAVSSGFAFAQNISNNFRKQFKILIVLCLITIILGSFKFSNLVSLLYPLFGYLGSAQMFFILLS